MNDKENIIFISYAREDEKAAKRLYKDLKNSDLAVRPWIDKEDLLPGQDFNREIKNLIHTSTFFIPLFSSISVQKRGYIQREFKRAIDTLEDIPPGDIFVIPIRLDECEIPYDELKGIHYQDFFPEWYDGLKMITKSIKNQLVIKVPNIDKEQHHSIHSTNNILIDDLQTQNNFLENPSYKNFRTQDFDGVQIREQDPPKNVLYRQIVQIFLDIKVQTDHIKNFSRTYILDRSKLDSIDKEFRSDRQKLSDKFDEFIDYINDYYPHILKNKFFNRKCDIFRVKIYSIQLNTTGSIEDELNEFNNFLLDLFTSLTK